MNIMYLLLICTGSLYSAGGGAYCKTIMGSYGHMGDAKYILVQIIIMALLW